MDKLTNDMEFSTRQIDPAHWSSLGGRYWLRAAMATVVAVDLPDVIAQEAVGVELGGGGVVETGVDLGGTPGGNQGENPGAYRHSRRYGTGLHQHPYAEICLGLAGRAMLDFKEQCYEFKPSMMAIFSPGVVHCEGYLDPQIPYSIFWLGGSGVALAARVHTYRPAEGWRTLGGWNVATPDVERLFGRMGQWNQSGGHTLLELIRSDILLIFSGLYQQATEVKSSSNAGDAAMCHKHMAILKNLRTMLGNHLGEQLSLDDLADLFGMSPNYLNSLFTRWGGESIHRYLIRLRMEKAMALLKQGDHMVKQVAHEVGYSDALYFSRAFRRYYGYSPKEVL